MKKVVSLILLVSILFSNLVFVKAEEAPLTMESVVEKFSTNLNNSNLSSNKFKVTLEDANIKISGENEEDDSISIPYQGKEITFEYTINEDEDVFGLVVYALIFNVLTTSVLELKGYNEQQIRWFLDLENATYETDGISYKVSGDAGSEKVKFKLNIDTIKLTESYIEASAPVITVKEVKENEVSLEITADVDNDTEIELYRSIDNENYEYIVGFTKEDDVNVTYTDNKLESGKTYYYKAVVKKSKNYSDVVKVVTFKEASTVPATNDEKAENPKTGSYSFGIIIVGLSILLGSLLLTMQRPKFNRL